MNVVVVGIFPEETKARISALFPPEWTLRIVAPEEAEDSLREADAVIPEHVPVDAAFLQRAPHLRLVQTGAGYDNVDIPLCTRRHVLVSCAPGINADAVAEHTLAMILCWHKNLIYLDSFMRGRGSERDLLYTGSELFGKTAGILGPGEIGRRTARLCGAFGMRVLTCGQTGRAASGAEAVGLDRLLAESDVLSIHVPLSGQTRHLIGGPELARMRSNALLVNTSRGGVLHQAALVEALQNRAIAGACLDVYEEEPLPPDSPLRDLPNVLLTPHTAGLPDGAKFHQRRYVFFVENLRALAEGRTPAHLLNGDAL